jgi:hypothetical protein
MEAEEIKSGEKIWWRERGLYRDSQLGSRCKKGEGALHSPELVPAHWPANFQPSD